jgi:hypothetical protein
MGCPFALVFRLVGPSGPQKYPTPCSLGALDLGDASAALDLRPVGLLVMIPPQKVAALFARA